MEYAQPNLISQQWRILQFLAQATGWRTRQDMYAFVGTRKGYSKALGAPTGSHNPNSLESLRLVKRLAPVPFKYKITSEGRRVLERHLADIGSSIGPQPPTDFSTTEPLGFQQSTAVSDEGDSDVDSDDRVGSEIGTAGSTLANDTKTVLNGRDIGDIDQTIRELTNCTGRPFLCDGSPMGCRVAEVGINPGTPTDFWSCWDVKTGCNKSAWIKQYLSIHGCLKPTRDRIEKFCSALLPERCLELNLTHHYTPDESSLSNEQIADTSVFSYMIQTVRPEIILVHGNKPIAHLERAMNTSIPKETFKSAVYEDVPLQIYAAKSHFSRVSRQYVIELADKIRRRLS